MDPWGVGGLLWGWGWAKVRALGAVGLVGVELGGRHERRDLGEVRLTRGVCRPDGMKDGCVRPRAFGGCCGDALGAGGGLWGRWVFGGLCLEANVMRLLIGSRAGALSSGPIRNRGLIRFDGGVHAVLRRLCLGASGAARFWLGAATWVKSGCLGERGRRRPRGRRRGVAANPLAREEVGRRKGVAGLREENHRRSVRPRGRRKGPSEDLAQMRGISGRGTP